MEQVIWTACVRPPRHLAKHLQQHCLLRYLVLPRLQLGLARRQRLQSVLRLEAVFYSAPRSHEFPALRRGYRWASLCEKN